VVSAADDDHLDSEREGPSSSQGYWQQWDTKGFRRRRRGPFARLSLFAAGADTQLLDLVPEEEKYYRRLGETVLVTTGLAFFSGTTASVLLLNYDAIDLRAFAIGAVFASIIFTIDRALVTLPLNPYRFPKAVLEELWNPATDAEYFLVLARANHARGPFDKLRQLLVAVASVAIRFLLALVISLFIAELVAVSIFSARIEDRLEAEAPRREIELQQQIEDTYRSEIETIEGRIESLATEQAELIERISGDGTLPPDPNQSIRAELRSRIEQLQETVAACPGELATVSAARAAEVAGEVQTFIIRGSSFTTSGLPGVGPVARSLDEITVQIQTACDQAADEKGNLEEELAALPLPPEAPEPDPSVRARITEIDEQIADLTAEILVAEREKQTEVDSIGLQVDDIDDLVTRREVLELLAQDADPSTLVVDEPDGGCSGSWTCPLRNFFRPGTPIGDQVGLIRALFLLIDLLPIIVKLTLSLRSRRPYDALQAAVEERHIARAVDFLDRDLGRVGGRMEMRATSRKSFRAGSGAESLFRSAERAGRAQARRDRNYWQRVTDTIRRNRDEDRRKIEDDRSSEGSTSGPIEDSRNPNERRRPYWGDDGSSPNTPSSQP
jgi:Domain of unknown function (DUF4407)